MLRKEGDKVYGILNDFDLAVRTDGKSRHQNKRNGIKDHSGQAIRPSLIRWFSLCTLPCPGGADSLLSLFVVLDNLRLGHTQSGDPH